MKHWSPSLRTKIIFSAVASLLLLALCLTFVTVYAVNRRKQEIVENTREMVHTLADQLTSQTARLREAGEIHDPEALRRNEGFRQMVGFVVSSADGVLVSLRYDYGEQRYEYVINPKAGEDLRVELRAQGQVEPAEAIREIPFEGDSGAKLVVKSVPDVLFQKINEAGRQITFRLLLLAVVLSILIALAFLLLWQIFRRHLERERVHEQLDRMAYVGTLASGLAHEIRNPLNAMNLNLDLIEEELNDPQAESIDHTRKIVGLLKSEVGRLSSTLTSFLQFALPSPRRLEMTDIVAVLEETASLLAPEMRRHEIGYRFHGERSCVTLADPAGLRQAFWNILLNAIQAVEERDERRIDTFCRVEDGTCAIEFRDTGPGIPPERREEVFEVFHSTRRGGSGFGLPIARQVVQRQGGTIEIDSLDGRGCVVHVRLPLRLERTNHMNPLESKRRPSAGTATER